MTVEESPSIVEGPAAEVDAAGGSGRSQTMS